LEKLGLDAEVISNRIIISYQFAGDGSEGDIYSKSYGSLSAALKDFGYWLDKDASSGQRNDFFQLFQQEYDQLPDFTKLSRAEIAWHLFAAGAASNDKMVNVNSVFKNFTPFLVENNNGSQVGLGNRHRELFQLTYGGHQYQVYYQLAIDTDSHQNWRSVYDMSINMPKTKLIDPWGEGTGFNYGHKADLYLWIGGDNSEGEAFMDWYYGH
jgi:hypothetical protein